MVVFHAAYLNLKITYSIPGSQQMRSAHQKFLINSRNPAHLSHHLAQGAHMFFQKILLLAFYAG